MSQFAQQPADPAVYLSLPLSTVNFILQSLDKNPLGVSVMQVAGLMEQVRSAAEKALRPAPEVAKALGPTEAADE